VNPFQVDADDTAHYQVDTGYQQDGVHGADDTREDRAAWNFDFSARAEEGLDPRPNLPIDDFHRVRHKPFVST
jgi:hypothetical protein